jgi:hypothetical protein
MITIINKTLNNSLPNGLSKEKIQQICKQMGIDYDAEIIFVEKLFGKDILNDTCIQWSQKMKNELQRMEEAVGLVIPESWLKDEFKGEKICYIENHTSIIVLLHELSHFFNYYFPVEEYYTQIKKRNFMEDLYIKDRAGYCLNEVNAEMKAIDFYLRNARKLNIEMDQTIEEEERGKDLTSTVEKFNKKLSENSFYYKIDPRKYWKYFFANLFQPIMYLLGRQKACIILKRPTETYEEIWDEFCKKVESYFIFSESLIPFLNIIKEFILNYNIDSYNSQIVLEEFELLLKNFLKTAFLEILDKIGISYIN